MALSHSPQIVRDGLVVCLDAANPKSYPGSGTTAFDLSNSSNNGTLINGVGFSQDNKGYFIFDGVNDIIRCGTFSLEYLTASTWVYKTSSTNSQGIFRKQLGWVVSQYNGTLQVAPATSWVFYNTGYVIPFNTWVNITYTYSGTGVAGSQTVYVNGSVIFSSSAGSGPISPNNNQVNLGHDNSNGWYWGGRISQTFIYNRALTAAEVKQNFEALRGRYGI
jgi:hypothetical protein